MPSVFRFAPHIVRRTGMMSYFSYPKGHGPPYNAWYPGMNYHPSSNGQFIDHNEMSTHQAAMYYGNPHIFQASPDWSHEFGSSGSSAAAGGLGVNGLQVSAGAHGIPVSLGSGPLTVGSATGGGSTGTSMTSLNGSGAGHGQGSNGNESGSLIASGLQSLPSPPVTVSGSEMSSPGAPAENASPQTSSLDPTPTKSPFQWMTKNPQPTTG